MKNYMLQGKEGVSELVIETVSALLKLGVYILKTPKLSVSRLNNNLSPIGLILDY